MSRVDEAQRWDDEYVGVVRGGQRAADHSALLQDGVDEVVLVGDR